MDLNQVFENSASGKFFSLKPDIKLSEIDWLPHQKFPGVFMKHLVTGADTDGIISCHLVRITAGHQIGDHFHETSTEIHEMISGHGTLILDGAEHSYNPGDICYMPVGKHHSVIAPPDEDICLMAKFTPPLV